ncbi:hypothetical protein [Rhizobium sp. CC-YZS058]|uniref:hypothetical protein n=1 Tax=Rhizobium sp. CC-YZS058 TaxID=3042153 RepID=UPI002B0589E1|nr:hypothetical protein [Rhizobium sp. CC-YZS058]MEA3534041.1 hypothetical protein [Rhizobium sp. CC-YZS058]
MGALVGLLSGVAATNFTLVLARLKRNAVLWAVIGLFLVTTYVLLVTAAAIALSETYGPLYATLILAGVSFALVLVVLVIMALISGREKRMALERRRQSQLQSNVAMAGAMALFQKRPLAAAAAAVVIGGLLGLTRGRNHD